MTNQSYVGRGRGIATNVNEEELIEQVKMRPLLYDKNAKEYRKPFASESAWKDIAKNLQTSVTCCKKRWKSLRDTFIKYYRYEMSDNRKNRKAWVYYKDLLFLSTHVELYRLNDSIKLNELQQRQRDSVQVYDYLESADEKQIFFTDDDPSSGDDNVYQIRIDGDYDEDDDDEVNEQIEDHLLDSSYGEEKLDSTIIDLEDQDQVVVNKVIQKLENDDGHTYMVMEQNQNEKFVDEQSDQKSQNSSSSSSNDKAEKLEKVSQSLQSENPKTSVSESSSQRNVVDDDERYLLSCLPAFKRLNPQQKAYVRMNIERVLYEVEFENIDELRNKRQRTS